MISSSTQNILRRLLHDAQFTLEHQISQPIRTIADINRVIIRDELASELLALTAIMSSEDIEKNFKDRCAERERLNRNTSLSFTALPDGVCNRLYLAMAGHLCKEPTTGALLNILMPNVTQVIEPEYTMEAGKKKQVHIQLKAYPIETKLLDSEEELNFSNYVVAGDFIFDVANIKNYGFEWHQAFKQAIQSQYPDLASALYRHNAALENLHQDIIRIVEPGPVPLVVIQNFMNQLSSGGQSRTGKYYASNDAQASLTNFQVYLQSLPESSRNGLLELRSPTYPYKTLAQIVQVHLLQNQGCVELAAAWIAELLSGSDNQKLLRTHPIISESALKEIHLKYGPKKPLMTESGPVGYQPIPAVRLERILKKLDTKNTANYPELLWSLRNHLNTPELSKYRTYIQQIHSIEAILERGTHFVGRKDLVDFLNYVKTTKPSDKVNLALKNTHDLITGRMSKSAYQQSTKQFQTAASVGLQVLGVLMTTLCAVIVAITIGTASAALGHGLSGGMIVGASAGYVTGAICLAGLSRLGFFSHGLAGKMSKVQAHVEADFRPQPM